MMNNTYSPIRETPREGTESYYYHEEPSSSIWSACFPCFQSKEVEANSLLHDSSSSSSSWMVNKLKELKEYSEVVAGPKWKNMVRKIGKYFNNNPNKKRTTQFQYDSDSYALNFANDDGNGGDDGLFRNFSSRFAAPFSASAVANNNNNNNPQRNDGL